MVANNKRFVLIFVDPLPKASRLLFFVHTSHARLIEDG